MRKLIGLVSVVVITLGVWLIQPQADVRFNWDMLNRFLKESHIWSGDNTLSGDNTFSGQNKFNPPAGEVFAIYDPSGNTLFSIGGGTTSGSSPYLRGALDLESGDDNVFIGEDAGGTAGTAPRGNMAIGKLALNSVTTATNNACIGLSAGRYIDDGDCNMLIGTNAGGYLEGGNYNVMIGNSAGYASSVDISSNVCIGANAGLGIDGSSGVFIGQDSGRNISNSNVLFIENSTTDAPLIFGDFANDRVRIGSGTTEGLTDTFTVEGGISAWYVRSGASPACNVPDSGTSLEGKYFGASITHDQTTSTIYGMAAITPSPSVFVKFTEGAVGGGITIYNVNGEPFMGSGLSGTSYLALPPSNPFDTCTIYSTQLSGTCKYWFVEASANWVAGN